jgi:hypothetical protein
MVALAMIERRQKLSLRKIAGAAENDEIERVYGDDLAGHCLSIPAPACNAGLI